MDKTNALIGAATVALVRTVVKRRARTFGRRYGPAIAGVAALAGVAAVVRRSRRSDEPAP
ncbi:MAG: hypothetical protein ACE5EV_08975 [Gaiellales bacterium]